MTKGNRMINGDFESGKLSPWIGLNASISSAHAESGTNSVRLTGDTSSSIMQFVDAAPGEVFDFTASLAASGSDNGLVSIGVQYYDADGGYLGEGFHATIEPSTLPDVATDNWSLVEGKTSPAPEGTDRALVVIVKVPSLGMADLFVDHVDLRARAEVPTGEKEMKRVEESTEDKRFTVTMKGKRKTETVKETEAVEAAEDTEMTETAEEIEAVEKVEATEVADIAEEIEAAETVEDTEVADIAGEIEAVETVEDTEVADIAEEIEAVETVEATEVADIAEEIEAVETVEATEVADVAEEIEEAKTVEDTVAVESAEATEAAETVEATGVGENAEAAEVAETAEDTEAAESAEVSTVSLAAEGSEASHASASLALSTGEPAVKVMIPDNDGSSTVFAVPVADETNGDVKLDYSIKFEKTPKPDANIVFEFQIKLTKGTAD